ncbi:hypothetical protein [Alkalihalobacillus sp. BA299]|uniref:hypothetical protein n=1 Tax=Alkalihalobacillus sp. BA299 TaxID=2815938 RepID=UPI001ADA1486|nr:hypothetical protein [Alkalihalobacillus sp. BA299]
MNICRGVVCAWEGVVEEIFIEQGSFVYEWEPLFLIKAKDGKCHKIQMSSSGYISTLNVEVEQQVSINSELAILQEDCLPCGCD